MQEDSSEEMPPKDDTGYNEEPASNDDAGNEDEERPKKKAKVFNHWTLIEWMIAGEKMMIKESNNKKVRRLNKDQKRVLAYKSALGTACREDNMLRALAVYEEMKTLNMQLDIDAFTTLLAVCGGNAGDKDELNSGNGELDTQRIARGEAKAAGPQPGSAELNPIIAADASHMIFTQDMPKVISKPIPESAYTSMIRAACLHNRVEWGLELLKQMLEAGAKPRIRSYGPLIAACATAGRLDDCLRLWKDAVDRKLCMTEREYLSLVIACTQAKDATRFMEVMSNYSEDVLRVRSRDGWDVLRAWFEQEGGWTITECKIESSGKCECCEEVLSSIELSDEMITRLLKQVVGIASAGDKRKMEWEQFSTWIESNGLEFDVIIDGANVGYYKRQQVAGAAAGHNFADHVQIDWVVQHYEAQGKRALVVLHSRHLQDAKLTPQSLAVVKKWREKGILASCAPGNNDDWYWLWAAVRIGGRTLVVTNDEMRDHHFRMLSHRSFQRWKERHQVHFSFGDWGEEKPWKREVLLEEPCAYSQRIQHSIHAELSTELWHIPVEGSEDWLCIRRTIPT